MSPIVQNVAFWNMISLFKAKGSISFYNGHLFLFLFEMVLLRF